ncbi:MAG: ketoacyl-ACP synthase III [Chloroflexi bacterium]|uniref:Ketoacyl-ACP synthase III n=1 Tax=Candidatus Chlorohelix allophototropha TaxID=3003348 RepID=A0A8T7M8B7_9CHLR|nr:ketoacyl-ACP synthase III [Chloroflexota bacterium]WJW68332.1 ketoacyl-ACP synthase III [Chloroflexota bacterium L227-S17]
MRVKISAIASALPEKVVTSAEVEQRVMNYSPSIKVPTGILQSLTGIKTRRFVEDHVNTSDLAAEACKKVLARTATSPDEIDLFIFASAGQDLTEPATSHITQYKVGSNGAVMDIKNACNSFINGIQAAEAMIMTGQYRKALVAVGETPSKCIKWHVKDKKDLRLSFPGYTFGDGGAAALLELTEEKTGLFYRKFHAYSQHWNIGTLPGGGSMHPRGEEYTYFQGDGTALKDAFVELGPNLLRDALRQTNTSFEDYARIFVHQVTVPFLEQFMEVCKVPADKVVVTLPQYGNMAAASLPVGFALAESRGEVKKGDKVMFIGLAGGISVGLMMFQY